MGGERATLRFWDLEVREAEGLVWMSRNAVEYGGLDDVRSGFDEVLDQLEALDREVMGLLIDVRGAPKPSNDENFERVVLEYRPRLAGPFAGAVLIVRTAAGKMQLSRMGRKNPTEVPVTDDPGEAQRFLAEVIAVARKRRPPT